MANRSIKWTITALYALIIACIGLATIIEKYRGTDFVGNQIYGAWWFSALWAVLTVAALAYIVGQRLYRRTAVMLLHVSFVVILAGALTTHLTAQRGMVRLRTGIAESTYIGKENKVVHLPFTLTLKEFRIVNYPGTDAPLDYQSVICADGGDASAGAKEVLVSMNNIGYIDGYRLFQQSYDSDAKGVTLGISHDPWGIGITYTGYLLLLLGIIATLLSRQTQMRALYRKAVTAVLLLASIGANAADGVPAVQKDIARRMGTINVLYNNRICPLNTVATDFVTKLTGSASWQGYSADEIFTSWMIYYSPWEQQPLIRVKSSEVQRLLGIDGQWAAYADFLDDYHEYKLAHAIEALRTGRSTADKKGLMDADEKFHMVEMFYRGQFIRMFPYTLSAAVNWYTPGAQSLPREIPVKEQFFIKQSMDFLTESIVTGQHGRAVEIIAKIKLFQRTMAGQVLPSENQTRTEIFYNALRSHKWPVFLALTLSLILSVVMLSSRKPIFPPTPSQFFNLQPSIFNLQPSPFHLCHAPARLTLVAQRPHPREQRPRDHAVHGVGHAAAHLPAAAQVPHHHGLWAADGIVLSAGGNAGGQQLAAHAPDACAAVAPALHPCDDSHVCLCALCPAGAARRPGLCADEAQQAVGTGPHHRPVTTAALPRRLPAGSRHFPGSHLGQCVVGQLLVVGPQRGLGPHHADGLRRAAAPHVVQHFPQRPGLPPLHGRRLPGRPHHLFWGELSAGRHAQLRLTSGVNTRRA